MQQYKESLWAGLIEMSTIKKPSFKPLPKERCSYCKSLENKLEEAKDEVQWASALYHNDTTEKLLINRIGQYQEIEHKLRDCRFPYCNGKCNFEE
jgi:hypothetical protein